MPRSTRATRLPRLHPTRATLLRRQARRQAIAVTLQGLALCLAAVVLLCTLPLVPVALPLLLATLATLPPVALVALPAGACATLAWLATR